MTMTPRRALRARWLHLAAPMAATAVVLAPPAPASAADEIEVSVDGEQWTTSYAGPIIAGGSPLAPGDQRSGSVFIRNSTAGDATLAVEATDVAELSGAFLDVTLREGTDVVASSTRPLADLAERPDLGLGDVVPGHGVRRLDVRVRLDESAGNETQDQSIAFTLVVSLQGEAVELPGTPQPGLPTQPGPLPRTGGGSDPLLIAAVAAVGAGFGLRVLSRRRR